MSSDNSKRRKSASESNGTDSRTAAAAAPSQQADSTKVSDSTSTCNAGSGASASQRLSVTGTVLAWIAVGFALHFAQAILLPITFALLIAVTLRPVVRQARRRRIPDSLTAMILILGLVAAGMAGLSGIADPAREWTSDLPERMEEVGARLATVRQQVEDLEEASKKIENIADGEGEPSSQHLSPLGGLPGSPPPAGNDEPVPVEVHPSRVVTAFNALGFAGSAAASIAISLVLAFFLLSRGDVLLNNILHALSTMREKRNLVELVYDVERGISRYLLTVSLINGALGIVIGFAMWLLGMPNPALWGMMAALFNFVPYLGALTGTIVVFLVAVLSFDSTLYACVVPVVYFSLTALEGNVITPSILGRTMQLNPLIVLLSLVFWGWMWGVGGALLAVPILATLKMGFDHFERTRAIGTLLGGEDV